MDSLTEIFGHPPSSSQKAAWDLMDLATRKRTLKRLQAIQLWEAKAPGVTAVKAAKRAGVGISRFYKMAADWRDTGSLDALGTVKASSRKRASKLNSEVVNALQAVVARVVAQNDDASVAKLVHMMIEQAGVTKDIPGKMKLREIVETEIRRSQAMLKAGDSIALDCCAISWARTTDRPFCVFLVIDRGTRIIFGHHVGSFEHDIAGYAAAAEKAIGVLDQLPLPWATTMRALQIVSGGNQEAYANLVESIENEFGISAKRASTAKRFGKYLREIVGLRIGPLTFTPPRTQSGKPAKVNGSVDVRSPNTVRRMVSEAIAAYNASQFEGQKKSGKASPPLVDVLTKIARLAS